MTTNTDPTVLVTPAARLAFPSLFKMRPRIKGSEKLSYQAVLLFPPGTDFKAFLAAATAALTAKFGKPVPLNKLADFPIRKCESLEAPPAGYEPGWHFISLHNTRRPAVVDRNGDAIEESDAEKLYGGCWVRASINAWAWEYTSRKGVSFGLNGIQLLRDDAPFVASGAAAARASFGDLGDMSDEQLGLPPARDLADVPAVKAAGGKPAKGKTADSGLPEADDGGFDFELP